MSSKGESVYNVLVPQTRREQNGSQSETITTHTPGPLLSLSWYFWIHCWHIPSESPGGTARRRQVGMYGNRSHWIFVHTSSHKITSMFCVGFFCFLNQIEPFAIQLWKHYFKRYLSESRKSLCYNILPNRVKEDSNRKQNLEPNWTSTVLMIKQLIPQPARNA